VPGFFGSLSASTPLLPDLHGVLNDLVEQFGIVPQCIDGMRATRELEVVTNPQIGAAF
jgi:hypothetical protein